MRIERLGDGAIRWERDAETDARALRDALRALPRVIDAIVTEKHACVTFDPAAPPEKPWLVRSEAESREARVHVIPVRYDGIDLDAVAESCGRGRDEVIALHASREYAVKLVGFMPGFAYLGDVDAAIAIPRRSTPRTRVPPGAVGIAATYTGVYPFASPGGWNLVGTAIDFRAFDPAHGARLALGDRVRFEPA